MSPFSRDPDEKKRATIAETDGDPLNTDWLRIGTRRVGFLSPLNKVLVHR